MAPLKKRGSKALRALAADVRKLPPLFLLGVAEVIKYRHKFKAANVLCRMALERVKDQDDSTMKGLALLSVGHAYWGVDEYPPAETHLRQAKALLERLPDGPFQTFYLTRSILLLGDTLVNLNRHDEAEDLGRQAEALIKKCRDSIEREAQQAAKLRKEGSAFNRWARRTRSWNDFCMHSMIELGELYYYTSCWEEGERLLRELVPMLVKVHGIRHGQTIEAQRDLASMLVNQDKYSEAEAAYRLAREWHERSPVFGREEQGAIDYNIAMCLSEQGQHHAAKEELRRLDIADDLFHYANGDWTLKLARTTHLALGEDQEVVDLCRRFEDVLDAKFGRRDEVTMKNLVDLACALNNLERHDEAVAVLRNMRQREDEVEDADEPDNADATDANNANPVNPPPDANVLIDPSQILETQRQLARALRLAGRFAESAFEFRKFLERAARMTPQNSWDEVSIEARTREALENLACLYEHAKDRENIVVAYAKLQTAYLHSSWTEANVLKYLCFRAKVFVFDGQPGPASALFRRALDLVKERKRLIVAELREKDAKAEDQQKPKSVKENEESQLTGVPPHTEGQVDAETEINGHGEPSEARVSSMEATEGGQPAAEVTPRIAKTLTKLEGELVGFDYPRETTWPSVIPVPGQDEPVQDERLDGMQGWDELVWWEGVIRDALLSVYRGEEFQTPAPVPLASMTSEWKTEETDDEEEEDDDDDDDDDDDEDDDDGRETIDAVVSRLGKFPFAPKEDEWAQKEFSALPDKWDNIRPRKEDVEWEMFVQSL